MPDPAPIRGRCWIWTTRDKASGQVQRGVMFHEPEASRAYVSVEEYIPVPDEAAIERAVDVLMADSGLPRFGPGRAAVERRFRLGLGAALEPPA